MKIELMDWKGERSYAMYDNFRVSDEKVCFFWPLPLTVTRLLFNQIPLCSHHSSSILRISTGCTTGCTVVRQEMPCLEGLIWWSSGQPLITACNSAPGTRIMIATCKETVLLRTGGAGGIIGDAEGFLNFMGIAFLYT